MSVTFNKKQLIITGLVCFATAFTIAYAVGQARAPVTTNPGSNLVPTATSSENPVASNTENLLETCITKIARVADPNPPLNVRSSPTITPDNIIDRLENGIWLSVVATKDGWFQISDPLKGWVAKDLTESSCSQKIERVRFAPGSNGGTISDRFIGTGNHQYLIEADRGQTLTVTKIDGIFPMIITPKGELLAGNPYQDDRQSWTGKIPEAGDYRLELISNFRGYHYSFSVQVK